MQLIKTVSCLLAGALALTFVSCEKEDKTISVEKIAINETSDKFIRRITRMEELLEADQRAFQDLPLKELDEYWEKAKKEEKF